MADHVQYWIELAEYDLETANAMFTTKRWLYVGFMCHQAVEKTMKSYWCKSQQNDPPYTPTTCCDCLRKVDWLIS